MVKNRTLIILTPGFPANEEDSTCLPPQQVFIKALKKANPDLKIIILAFQYPFVSSQYFWNGIRIISFNGRNKGKLRRLLTWIRVWKALKKINRENELIGILSFWLGECSFIGKRFAKRYQLKHYCWLLGQDARKKNKYIRRTRPRAEELITMSDFLANELHRNYGLKPEHIIPIGIDTTLFSADTDLVKDIDILGAGSLIPLKQYDLFITLLNDIKQSHPSVKARICGKGPEEDRLRSMVGTLQLDHIVSLAGEKSHIETLKLMQRSKILLHTSSYEGFGMVLLEALYAGAHVISFVKPMDEALNHHHVVNNEQEMHDKLIELLQQQNLDHEPILPYPIEHSASQILSLFIS